jgi:DNA polymerase-3 subunit epsilon
MVPRRAEPPLSELEVLVVDCQATAAAPRGHVIEIGWARADASSGCVHPDARLVALPGGERVPPAVTRVTGITQRMLAEGVEPSAAWRGLAAAASALTLQPPPTVIHFVRFEQPFLHRLAGGAPPLDIVCTHEIARRLLPGLPRRSLRALAGYFGHAVSALRRSGDHAAATALVWRDLVRLLEGEGINTWSGLQAWLRRPWKPVKGSRRAWPMPRSVRLALPDGPGIYRMLRTTGDVLYVGKAASLHGRVNSYFRHQRGIPERMLEMLTQARDISFEATPTALEAALVESDEIKRLLPPYNIALAEGERRVWFAARDLAAHAARPSARYPVGPFGSREVLEEFTWLVQGNRAALGRDRWSPDASVFREGYARFCTAHPESVLHDGPACARLLRLGARLWREGRRDRDDDDDQAPRVRTWTPESVQLALEWLVIRAALARRRAAWFTRLAEATVTWREPGGDGTRLLVIENGEVVARGIVEPQVEPPVPPGRHRSRAERHDAFTVARFDRLRVLTTELKRLSAAAAPVAVRLGLARPITGPRLAALLAWV